MENKFEPTSTTKSKHRLSLSDLELTPMNNKVATEHHDATLQKSLHQENYVKLC